MASWRSERSRMRGPWQSRALGVITSLSGRHWIESTRIKIIVLRIAGSLNKEKIQIIEKLRNQQNGQISVYFYTKVY